MNLQDELTRITLAKNALDEEAAELLRTTPVTDTELPSTISWWGNAPTRYILVQPDGSIYHGVPGMSDFGGVTFTQRPAALRAVRGRPGCRVIDVKTGATIS